MGCQLAKVSPGPQGFFDLEPARANLVRPQRRQSTTCYQQVRGTLNRGLDAAERFLAEVPAGNQQLGFQPYLWH